MSFVSFIFGKNNRAENHSRIYIGAYAYVRNIFIKNLLYIISGDKTIINWMKKIKNKKNLSPEEKKHAKRKVAIALSFVFLTPLICISVALGVFAVWSQSQRPDKNLLPTATAAPVFYDINGNELPYIEENYINPGDIPSDLKNAFVALEDKRFYTHKGYDLVRMAGALFSNIKSQSLKEGASTITQQLVKNTHLSHEKTASRKLKEIAIASNIEKEYSKDEILAMYLSVIYFGNGAYGVKQASKLYFDKGLNELNLAECATLAGIVKNPKKYSPFSDENQCVSRRNLVLSVMKKEGYIDNDTFEKTTVLPLISAKNKTKSGTLNGRICDLYINSAINEICDKFDITKYELSNSAFKIYLNLDLNLQRQIASIGKNSSLYSTDKIDSAVIVLNNDNHSVAAYWSNLPYQVKRQAGSSLKPLAVYAPALDMNVVTLATPITDERVSYGDFSPTNYGDIYYGDTTIRQAIKKSMNSVSVKTLSYIGVDNSVDYLKKLGIYSSEADKNYALALGAISNGVQLKEIADAYATFASEGNFQKASFINYVTKNDRKIYSDNRAALQKALKASTCDQINSALSDTVKDGTAITLSALDFDVCAKTGTVERQDGKNSDAWCASYNNDFTVVVWHGSDDGMNEKGGGFSTKHCLNVWQTIEKEHRLEKTIKKSNSSVVLDVDLYATKQNRSVMIANDNTPSEYRKQEIFSIDNQYEMSSCFDIVPPEKSDFYVEKNANGVTITINTEEIYSYRVSRIDMTGETILSSVDGKTSGSLHLFDAPLVLNDFVRYKVECFVTCNPTARSMSEKEVYIEREFLV